MKQKYANTLAFALIAMVSCSPALAQNYYIGQIFWTAATYCPRGSLEANGAELKVTNYKNLHLLYGDQFGGDGITAFKTPDLRVTVPVGAGKARSGHSVDVGQRFGGIGCPEGESCSPEYQEFLGIRACVWVDGIYPERTDN